MGVTQKISAASKASYHAIERKLSGVFRTVPPREEFVDTLGRHILIHPPAVRDRWADLHAILLILAGVFSIVALIAVGLRAVFTLVTGRRRSPRQA